MSDIDYPVSDADLSRLLAETNAKYATALSVLNGLFGVVIPELKIPQETVGVLLSLSMPTSHYSQETLDKVFEEAYQGMEEFMEIATAHIQDFQEKVEAEAAKEANDEQ